jgi:hypothetical protein
VTSPDDEAGAVNAVGLGSEVFVSPGAHEQARARFDERLRVAQLGGDHLWTAMATFLVDPERLTTGGPGLLDSENLGGVYLGCYRCEQAYEPRLLKRRCPGDR